MRYLLSLPSRLSRFQEGETSSKAWWLRRRWLTALVMLLMLGVAFWGVPAIAFAADRSGADTQAANPNAGLNMAWTLIGGFLVFIMQLGFAFLEY